MSPDIIQSYTSKVQTMCVNLCHMLPPHPSAEPSHFHPLLYHVFLVFFICLIILYFWYYLLIGSFCCCCIYVLASQFQWQAIMIVHYLLCSGISSFYSNYFQCKAAPHCTHLTNFTMLLLLFSFWNSSYFFETGLARLGIDLLSFMCGCQLDVNSLLFANSTSDLS